MATRDVGTTQRPPSSALLTIDSEDRFASIVEKRNAALDPTAYNRSPYDFALIRNASLVNGYMTRLGVTEVVFPWLIPNINENTYIIKAQYSIGGGPLVTIYPNLTSQTFKRPSEIAAELESFIQASGLAAFQMTYGVDGKPRFTYDAGAGNTIAFFPLPSTGPIPLLTLPDNTVQLFDLLGFVTSAGGVAGNDAQKEADGGAFTFCVPTRYVDITSPQLTANQGLRDATSQAVGVDSLCRIYLGDNNGNSTVTDPADPMFCPPGCAPTVIYRQFNTPKQIQWNTIMPVNGRIQFQVYDDNGAILGKSAGIFAFQEAEWSMTLLLTEN